MAAADDLPLLPLLTGSSELNSDEHVSQQLHDRNLPNRGFDSYDQIVDACCEAWNTFTQIPDATRSLCSRNRADLPHTCNAMTEGWVKRTYQTHGYSLELAPSIFSALHIDR